MQRAHGKDQLAVVLLSVDPSYFDRSEVYEKQAGAIFRRHGVDWPSIFLPKGWEDAMDIFNASGYGLILVDARGIVRNANVLGGRLDNEVKAVLESKPGGATPRDVPKPEPDRAKPPKG